MRYLHDTLSMPIGVVERLVRGAWFLIVWIGVVKGVSRRTDGVDKGGDETGQTTEQLEETDTTRSQGIRPKLDKVGWRLPCQYVNDQRSKGKGGLTVCQGVVTNIVGRAVQALATSSKSYHCDNGNLLVEEDEYKHSPAGCLVRLAPFIGSNGFLHRNSPSNIDTEQTIRNTG